MFAERPGWGLEGGAPIPPSYHTPCFADIECRLACSGALRRADILAPEWQGDSRTAALSLDAWASHFAFELGDRQTSRYASHFALRAPPPKTSHFVPPSRVVFDVVAVVAFIVVIVVIVVVVGLLVLLFLVVVVVCEVVRWVGGWMVGWLVGRLGAALPRDPWYLVKWPHGHLLSD